MAEVVQTPTGGVQVNFDDSGAAPQLVLTISNTIARTDTTAKTLGVVPANALMLGYTISNPVASDAATTAVVSMGKSGGTGVEFLNTVDVKGGALGQITPTTKATLGTVGGTKVTVTGIYAETGAASTTGGPWRVTAFYIVP